MNKLKLSEAQNANSIRRMKAAQYMKVVTWSEEDKCFIGRCPELFAGGIHGDNDLSVYRELCQTVDEWIATIEDDEKPLPKPTISHIYSGKFVLRMSPAMHETLAIRAALEKESLNTYTVKSLASLTGIEASERAARGKKVNIRRLLAKVPDVAPPDEDRLD